MDHVRVPNAEKKALVLVPTFSASMKEALVLVPILVPSTKALKITIFSA